MVLSPDWLQPLIEPGWFDRYLSRADDFHLPTARTEREALAQRVGQDGWKLLKALDEPSTPEVVRHSDRVGLLWRIWDQQYELRPKTVRWRKAANLPANADLLVSPEDPEVRASKKRDEYWVGYKVHITETCDEDAPHLITHVETSSATTQDDQVLLPIHTALQNKGLLPAQHIVDAGYTNSFRLADSQQEFGIDLVGKVSVENGWQAHTPGAFPLSAFQIDFEHHSVTCPASEHTNTWVEAKDGRGQPVIHAAFPRQVCLKCPLRSCCTLGNARGRVLTFRPQVQYEALRLARERQTTEAFKRIYAKRAGIEGTLSQAIQRSDLRHARYRGRTKTHLQHVFIAMAVNVVRVFDWIRERPRATTRQTPFAQFASAA